MEKAEIIEDLASKMAILFNGGLWNVHYTEAQKEVWRKRVRAILAREEDDGRFVPGKV